MDCHLTVNQVWGITTVSANQVVTGPLLDKFRKQKIVKIGGLNMDLGDMAPIDTQVFVLSDEVALAAEKLIRNKSFKFTPVEEMRLPYPHMAVEYSMTEDIQALCELKTGFPISAKGCYMHSDAKAGWITFLPYWVYGPSTAPGAPPEGTLETSLVSFIVGMSDTVSPNLAPKLRIINRADNPSAVIDVNVMPALHLIKFAVKNKVPAETLYGTLFNGKNTRQMIQEGGSELSPLLYASAMLLNCKSGIGLSKVAARKPPSGSRFGAKKRKNYSHCAYTVVYLNEAESVSQEGVVSRRSDLPAHYVRGHFKQRKHGTYWWNPFIRGVGELRPRVAYDVRLGGA